jgi:hypothetical protein
MSKLYKLVNGQYVLARIDEVYDTVPVNTTFLTTVTENGKSRQYNVNPDFAKVLAVLRCCRDEITDKVLELQQLRTRLFTKHTPEQAAAWQAYINTFEQDPAMTTYYESASQLVNEIGDIVVDAACRVEQGRPHIKEAWERFNTFLTLSIDKE